MPSRTVSTSRRFALVGAGILLALCGFELALQGVAFAMWANGHHHTAQARDDAQLTVLCVGDSFTYGLGASRPEMAYPAQAQRISASRGVPAKFENRGWPGNTSRDVLASLPRDLAETRPDIVCLLVGTNDFFFRPAELAPGEIADGGFRWRLRSLRFLQLVLRNTEGQPGDPPAFLGSWHDDRVELTFAPGGTLEILGSPFEWFVQRGDLMLRDTDGWVLPIEWSVERGRLHLPASPWWPELELEPGRMPAPDATTLDEVAVAIHVANRHRDLAQPHLEALRARFERKPDAKSGAALATALETCGEIESAVLIACETVERAAPAPRAATLLERHAREDPRVLETLRRAHASSEPGSAWRTALARAIVRSTHRDSPAAAANLLCRSILEAGEHETTVRWLRNHGVHFDDDVLRAAIEPLVDRPGHELLEHIRAAATTEHSGAADVLATHLGRIAELCDAAGIELVLVAYPGGPFAKPEVGTVVDRIAEARRITVIRPGVRFPELSSAAHRSALYVADGHCTDAGYERIAEAVAEHVAALAERR